MSKKFDAVLRLRRDNDFNYAKIENTFVPANGEVCLIDTSSEGLRTKIGDGVSPFNQLNFVDNILIKGYLNNGIFYETINFENPIQNFTNKIYLDYLTYCLYLFDGTQYKAISSNIPYANSQSSGIMKLYSTTGQNIDGTMSQKAISDKLNNKIEMSLNEQEETLLLNYNIN